MKMKNLIVVSLLSLVSLQIQSMSIPATVGKAQRSVISWASAGADAAEKAARAQLLKDSGYASGAQIPQLNALIAAGGGEAAARAFIATGGGATGGGATGGAAADAKAAADAAKAAADAAAAKAAADAAAAKAAADAAAAAPGDALKKAQADLAAAKAQAATDAAAAKTAADAATKAVAELATVKAHLAAAQADAATAKTELAAAKASAGSSGYAATLTGKSNKELVNEAVGKLAQAAGDKSTWNPGSVGADVQNAVDILTGMLPVADKLTALGVTPAAATKTAYSSPTLGRLGKDKMKKHKKTTRFMRVS